MVKAVRVKGIVKLMNRVREKLSNGLSVRELEELKVCVDNSLDTIESICVQNQIVPTDLPAPSYRAYSYLKNLDLNKIVPVMPSQQGRGKKEIKIPGLVKQCHSISDEINRLDRDFYSRDSEVYARETESVFQEIRRIALDIEQGCRKMDAQVFDLPIRTLRAYQWLKHLSVRENFQQLLTVTHHLGELTRDPANQAKFRKIFSLEQPTIEFVNSSSIYSLKITRRKIRIKINLAFIYTGQSILRDVLDAVLFRDRKAKERIRIFTVTDNFYLLRSRIEYIGQPPGDSHGQYHDLDASFARVNQEYFQNKLQKPRLTWNKIITSRLLGLWIPSTKTLVVSITLDAPDVPEFVLDFIIYHELLHMALKTTVINGRFYAHTPEFKRREKQYARYAEVQKMLPALMTPAADSTSTLS